MHESDTCTMGRCGIADIKDLVAHRDVVTGIWLVKARQDFDQGRFTGAILTHQGMNFAFLNIESGILQGDLSGKGL